MKKEMIASHLSALVTLVAASHALSQAARHRADAERMIKHQPVMAPHSSMVTHGSVVDGHGHGGHLATIT